jgi:hypothetical protein
MNNMTTRIYLLLLAGMFLSDCVFAQGLSKSGMEKEEQEMQAACIDGKMEKRTVDVNGDGEEDLLYYYAVGEIHNFRAYIRYKDEYIRKIDILCGNYSIYRDDRTDDTRIRLQEWGCCGENPFFRTWTYKFDGIAVSITENYIETNEEYTEGKKTAPASWLDAPYYVTTLNDNYNLRFSPDMDAFTNEADVWFTCRPNTNIIATVKSGIRLKVLSEQSGEGRTWLYVEVEIDALRDKCDTETDFDKENLPTPVLRGWVSGRYTERE